MRSGAMRVRLGEDGVKPESSISQSLSDIDSESEFYNSLYEAMSAGVITQAEADSARRARWARLNQRNRNIASIVGPVTSGGGKPTGTVDVETGKVTLNERAGTPGAGSPPFDFMTWWRCDNKTTFKGTPFPDSWSRPVCQGRNAVLIVAAGVVVFGAIFLMKEMGPE